MGSVTGRVIGCCALATVLVAGSACSTLSSFRRLSGGPSGASLYVTITQQADAAHWVAHRNRLGYEPFTTSVHAEADLPRVDPDCATVRIVTSQFGTVSELHPGTRAQLGFGGPDPGFRLPEFDKCDLALF